MSDENYVNKPITITGLIYEFMRGHKYMVVLYILFLLAMPISDIGIPHLFGKLVKAIETKTDLILPLIYLFVATIILQFAFSIIALLEIELSPRFQAFVRHKIMKHIFEDNDENFSEVETGTILSRYMRLPHSLYVFMNQWKYNFIPNFILSIAAIVYFLFYNLLLGVALMVLIVFAWTMIYVSIQKCINHSYKTEKTVTKLYEETDDILKNMSVVLVSNTQQKELDNMQTYEDTYRTSVKDTMICSLKLRYTIVPFNIGYFILFMYVCYGQVKRKILAPSTFVALIIIVFKIFNSIWDISGIMNDTVTRYGLLTSTMEIFNHKNMAYSSNTKTNLYRSNVVPNTGFFIDDITFIYRNNGTQTTLLENFSMHIPQGKTTVIVGGIGSGKSTILKLLLKQLTPDKGSIYYQGVSYNRIPTSDIRRLFCFIQQQPVLMNRTIYENMTYGIDTDRKHVMNLIQSLELDDMFSRFPNGLDTKVGKYGSNLSGGQRQILLILRAMLTDPLVILMDEPTASIDETTKKMVYNILSKIMKNKTVVMVTHDDFLLKYADRLVEMQKGKIVKEEIRGGY